jgi:hypothetical protein
MELWLGSRLTLCMVPERRALCAWPMRKSAGALAQTSSGRHRHALQFSTEDQVHLSFPWMLGRGLRTLSKSAFSPTKVDWRISQGPWAIAGTASNTSERAWILERVKKASKCCLMSFRRMPIGVSFSPQPAVVKALRRQRCGAGDSAHC